MNIPAHTYQCKYVRVESMENYGKITWKILGWEGIPRHTAAS